MQKMKYKVRFLTPAFLGNAEQNGQWRTPPFKALLRQWWRVAVAKEVSYDYTRLREREGRLFGHAWLKDDKGKSWASKSQVRLRLEPWLAGRMTNEKWPGGRIEKIITTRDGKGKVRSDLYLGFGPVLPSKRDNRKDIELAHNAIDVDTTATLQILSEALPDEHHFLCDTIQLIHWFGALGSRSRNGWGSLILEGPAIDPASRMIDTSLLSRVTQYWKECLHTDWANAIGCDEHGPLIWVTGPVKDWQAVVKEFASHLVSVRRVAKDFHPRGQANGLHGIHLLGYPAGSRWQLSAWGNDGRLASPLRFKVIAWDEGLLRGMIFHIPCNIPESLRDKLGNTGQDWLTKNQEAVWAQVHEKLDNSPRLIRMSQPG